MLPGGVYACLSQRPDALPGLPRLIGPGFAADAVLRGRVFSAKEALRIGWLDAVLPVDGFVDAAVAWCQEMADLPSAGLFAAKRVLVRGLELSLE
ncbi:enoyl-CoA hydratase/isomerase family protein [Streptomyces sp. NPDC056669]|uniref:enoyl-CoA hydratase/isomerase family protein n=1 Tax=unclassified Streptomyces TaxID=2593676 RepID=UPI0036B9729A